jgi:hypothetical protein|tara:strand:- start:20315 stop:20980 length:666 start_codon:yes stop_codon:yes gene_type:complete
VLFIKISEDGIYKKMTSSGEYLEKLKKKQLNNYSSTFSGYSTNGALDSSIVMMDRKLINSYMNKDTELERIRRKSSEIEARVAAAAAEADAKACPIIFRIKNNELQMKATDYFLSTYSSTIYLKGVYGLLIKDGQLGDFVNNNWSYSSDTGQLKLDLAVSRNRDMYPITNEYTTITKNCSTSLISSDVTNPPPLYVFVSKSATGKHDVIKISNKLMWKFQT